MTQFLKQSTEVDVMIGPAVEVGNGFVPVIGLTLSGADEAEILKHDASAVTSISGATFAAITAADGYYFLTITTALSDTLGQLTVLINDDSLILPIKQTFMVLPASAYDAIVLGTGAIGADVKEWLTTAAATPTIAGVPEVDLTHWLGTAAATPTVAGVPEVDITHVSGSATIAEATQQAPPATPALDVLLATIYGALRNKIDVTATLKEFHNDAGTVVWKKVLSDDATTYSEAEGVTGP